MPKKKQTQPIERLTMLEPRYRQMLIDAVDLSRIDKEDYVLENPKLEAVIKLIKAECPEKFHSDQTVGGRTFYDEPSAPRAPVYHAGFVRPMRKLNRY
jgi:hypothetical protein